MQQSRGVKTILSVLSLVMTVTLTADVMADRKREQMQAELDAACEAAREKKLAPLRKRFIEECVAKREQPDRRSCEVFYSDYGAQSGNRAPLFYDLPECVEAFEFQQGQRRRD